MMPFANGRAGRSLRVIIWLLVGVGVLAGACATASAPPRAVHILKAKGAINPVLAGYIDRGIDRAEGSQAAAVVLRLDTPGGLDSSMRDIIQRILRSQVPVVVYVWPPGGRAASAGTFITMAAHVAAMSPNTTIGAAHPVGGGGEEIEGTLGEKVTNDAAAYIKELARQRGRNAEWAERAVRESISASSGEALEQNVVDLVAPDLPSLLAAIDGRQVSMPQGTVTLRTADAPLVYNDMNLLERFLLVISDPNIAFILLSLGATALIFEFLNPGAIFPGVFGGISLLLAFYSLGTLPVNWAALLLIGLAFILFVLELFMTSYGVLAIGGVLALGLGGLMLMSSSPPGIELSRWVVFGTAGTIGAFFAFIVSTIFSSRRRPAAVGSQSLVGQQGVARSALKPKGVVFVGGELWSAEAMDGEVAEGEPVVIVAVAGLHLRVQKAERR